MRNRMMRPWRVACVLLAFLLVGTIAGAGIALAHPVNFNILSQWMYYPAYHHAHAPVEGIPNWFFYQGHWAWANSGKTQIVIDDTTIDDDESHTDPRTDFGVQTGPVLYIGDEDGNHRVEYSAFPTVEIRSLNSTRDTYWYYDGLGSGNTFAYVLIPIMSGNDYLDEEVVYFLTGY